MPAGTLHGLHVVVPDIELARTDLVGRGIEVSDYFHFGPEGQKDGLDPERRNYSTYVSFQDPDENTWLVQVVDLTRAGTSSVRHTQLVGGERRGDGSGRRYPSD